METGDATRQARATAIGAILLIDGQDLTRRSMARLLCTGLPALRVIEARDLKDAAGHAGTPLDVILFNPGADAASLPGALRRLKDLGGSLRAAPVALVLRGGLTPLPADILDLGVRGCIGPAVGAEDLMVALRLIIGGAVFIGPGMLGPAAPALPPSPAARPVLRASVSVRPMPRPIASSPVLRPLAPPTETALTARETQVLLRLREGKPNKIIAHEMGISENTVKVHVRRILRKLRAANRTEAASFEDVETTPAFAARPYAAEAAHLRLARPPFPSSSS
ncbi:LuxR C-terminal-related transcriptional regulator [Novispirillum sp. DQ9]|uniref:helix-turn-helix transcriptional regulator n=1 Tax=Novispirillum sp. DQ9 TaxID=3398612 RepID=UPI003C79B895